MAHSSKQRVREVVRPTDMLGCSCIRQKLDKLTSFSHLCITRSHHKFTEPARLRVILHQRGDRPRCDSGRAAWRFDRLLLIHFGNSVLVSTVFLLVSPFSTVTTAALKLRTALVFTLVLSFALVLAFLALGGLAFLASVSVHSVASVQTFFILRDPEKHTLESRTRIKPSRRKNGQDVQKHPGPDKEQVSTVEASIEEVTRYEGLVKVMELFQELRD